MRSLPNGRYTLGVRPHCISPVRNGGAAVEIGGRVQITELGGAESVIHFAHGNLSWISQSHGVHAMQVGETATFYVIKAGGCDYASLRPEEADEASVAQRSGVSVRITFKTNHEGKRSIVSIVPVQDEVADPPAEEQP